MSTETEKTGKAAENGSQTKCGHADDIAALTARLAAAERERDVAHAAASRFAAEGCAAQANCLAAEAERDARDADWQALVGSLLPHVRHAAGCDLALPTCQCGALTAIARGLAALADTSPQAMPDYTNHAPGCPMRASGGILPGCSCGALTDAPPTPRGAAE